MKVAQALPDGPYFWKKGVGSKETKLLGACVQIPDVLSVQVAVGADSEAAEVAADEGGLAVVHGGVVGTYPAGNVL